MKRPIYLIGICLIVGMTVLSACGANSRPAQVQSVSSVRTATLSADQMTATLCSVATRQAGDYVMLYDLFGTPTPDPRWLSAVPTPTLAPVGTDIPGDPVKGLVTFNTIGTCSACHRVMDDTILIGPSLKGIAERAATRMQGLSAKEYIRDSILRPNDYLVPGMPSGVMPISFEQTLTPEQIADVIAYLLTL